MFPKILLFALVFLSGIISTSAQSTDSVLYEQNVNGVWQNSSLNILSNDEQCRVGNVLSKTWDPASQTWFNNSLYKSKYDNADRVSEHLIQLWNSDQQEWVNNLLTRYDYLNNGKTITSTDFSWDQLSNSWQNDERITTLFNDAGYSYYTLQEHYIDPGWQPEYRYTTKYDSNNRVVSFAIQNYQDGTWININKQANRYSKNGLHVGTMFYYWHTILQEWYKSIRRETNYLPGGMLSKNALSQYYYFDINKWINNYYSVNEYNSNQQTTSSKTVFWDTFTNQWVNGFRYRYDYYDDGSVHHFYLDLGYTAPHVWNTDSRTTYTHHGCILELNITADEHSENSNSANRKMMGKDGVGKRITDNKADGHSWSYDVPIHSSNGTQQGITTLHFTIKAKPANAVAISNKMPITKATLPTGNSTFVISPNPAKGYFVVTPGVQVQPVVDATLAMYDLSGKLIMTKKLQGTGAQKIALPAVGKGLYIVTITSAKSIQSMKLAIE